MCAASINASRCSKPMPLLLLLLASALLLVKALHSDMVNTRIERDVRRLNQRLALLEADAAKTPPSP